LQVAYAIFAPITMALQSAPLMNRKVEMTARLWRRVVVAFSTLLTLGLLLSTVGAPHTHGG